jgi:CheY-like chemotaxis protein
VEDHADTRHIMVQLLKGLGCTVITAGSVAEALAAAQEHEFDLLISDIGLPDGSGIQIIRELKQRRQLKGIAVSGNGQDDDMRRSREAGFDMHLTKPINFQMLRQMIRKAIIA